MGRGRLIGALVVAVVLLVGSVAATVAWGGSWGRSSVGAVRLDAQPGRPGAAAGSTCTPADVSPSEVRVTESEMGGTMMGARSGGRMWLRADTPTVPAGKVTFVVTNQGSRTHELVVLPLTGGLSAGDLAIGADGKVDESAAVGEASTTCGAGAGDGIRSGSSGWVTLDLAPGRYALVCNLAGHYGAGMSTELTVS